LTVTDSVEVPPALVAEHDKVLPAVSVPTVVGPQPVLDVMGPSSSVTLQVTVTSPVYQPFCPKGPVTIGVITGNVVSAGSGVATEIVIESGLKVP
jgi:hypothetical protein